MSCLQRECCVYRRMLYWEMMELLVVLLLLLAFSGVTCSAGDQCTGPLEAASNCTTYGLDHMASVKGEGLRFTPDNLRGSNENFDSFTWHRQTPQGNTTSFSSSEEDRIHHHGPTLFFLPLSAEDTGIYNFCLTRSDGCHMFSVSLVVKDVQTDYVMGEDARSNPIIYCPEQVADRCKKHGVLSWYKNSSLIAGNTSTLLVHRGNALDKVTYTCRCTWEHNKTEYFSTASRTLPKTVKLNLVPIRMTKPSTQEMTAHLGSRQEIECEAYFGSNIKSGIEVLWEKNNHSISKMEGYKQNNSRTMKEETLLSSILIINKVKEDDLYPTFFTCRASNGQKYESRTLSLKPPESLTNLVVALVCVSLLLLLTTAIIKYFVVDLVLFFRRFLSFSKACSDRWQHDVYVVYHSQQENVAIEEVLNKFLSRALPLVLEQRCGYRVFIQGRDDIPGEDWVEQVEERVRLSRTLMMVLTPGLEVNEMLNSSPSSPTGVDIHWQVALYHALVQELRVILVQLGEVGPQGYTHLSVTLQHLVHKCAPLCWQEDSQGAAHWNSRFWKRVRYAMPSRLPNPLLPVKCEDRLAVVTSCL